jgi:hypothetical protein
MDKRVEGYYPLVFRINGFESKEGRLRIKPSD